MHAVKELIVSLFTKEGILLTSNALIIINNFWWNARRRLLKVTASHWCWHSTHWCWHSTLRTPQSLISCSKIWIQAVKHSRRQIAQQRGTNIRLVLDSDNKFFEFGNLPSAFWKEYRQNRQCGIILNRMASESLFGSVLPIIKQLPYWISRSNNCRLRATMLQCKPWCGNRQKCTHTTLFHNTAEYQGHVAPSKIRV